MLTTDTIVAVASGWGRGEGAGRALIRASGPAVRGMLRAWFAGAPDRGGQLAAARFAFSQTPPLELPCVVMRFDQPRSYTGQDAFEMLVVGNPLLVERVLNRLTAWPEGPEGRVREAGPGEFSARAFLLGKLTLAEAEGVAALIGARTADQLAAAERLMNGSTGAAYRAWADEAAMLLALVEAGIDFTDQEDVVPIPPPHLAARLDTLARDLAAHLGAGSGREHAAGEVRVVLAGAPNAGKSTLFNALLDRRRSVESPVAGTTRDAIVEPLELGPGIGSVQLVDLAGLDDAASSAGTIDRQAQARAREEIERADVIVHCDPGGRFVRSFPGDPARPVLNVRTKADLPIADLSGQDVNSPVLAVCALDRWNLAALKRAIADAAWSTRSQGISWLLPRHRRTLAAALHHLQAAREQVDSTQHALRTPELVAGSLRSAVDELSELVGDISPDDIIGRIFATFCVGK